MFIHWVADFTLQSEWMALNKSKNNLALASHAAAYYAGITVLMIPALFLFSWYHIFIFTALNGIIHLTVDYVSSRITSYLWKEERVHDFFVIIGLDQFIHVSILYLTMLWCL